MKRLNFLIGILLIPICMPAKIKAESEISQIPLNSLYRIVEAPKSFPAIDPFDRNSYSIPIFEIGGEQHFSVHKDFRAAFVTPENTDFNNFPPGRHHRKDLPLWLYKYSVRADGLPNPIGLHKWAKPILVSARLPYDLGPDSPMPPGYKMSDIAVPYSAPDEQTEKNIGKIISEIAPELEPLIGLPIDYIDPDEKGADEKANIRIVYVDNLKYWKTVFKSNHHVVERAKVNNKVAFKPEMEDSIDTRYEFTPRLNNQVEGYIIADPANQIDFSYCYVWKYHHPALFKALVLECLLRSLGFPNTINSNSKLLGAWNGEVANPLSEKRDTNAGPLYKLNPEETEQIAAANFYHNKIPAGISAYEKLLIRLLYDKALKSGAYHREVWRTLSDLMPQTISSTTND